MLDAVISDQRFGLRSDDLPSVLITLGFFIPAYIIGYFGLQVRELEAK